MRKINRKGFTLIELLVVITIISLVFSISVYFVSGAIKSAKEKTYLTTINEVEKAAGNYLLENSDELYFIKYENVEYQCVTVKDLIDYGFLDNDVLKSKINDNGDTIGINNYIYIERNITSKTVEKNVYIANLENSYSNICTASVNATGGIYFNFDSNWTKQKDVEIIYELRNVSNINNYKFGYKYLLENNEELISYRNDTEMHKTISGLSQAGNMYADIQYYDGDTSSKIVEANKSIKKFDNVGPVIDFGNDEEKYVSKTVTIPLSIKDCNNEGNKCSGLKDYTATELETIKNNKIVVKVGTNVINSNNITLTKSSTNVYNLTINNNNYDGNIKIEIAANSFVDKVVDEVKNGNIQTTLNSSIKFDNTNPVVEFVMLDSSNNSTVASSNYSLNESNSLNWFKFTPKLKYIGEDGGSGLADDATFSWNSANNVTLNKTISNSSIQSWDNNKNIFIDIASNGYRYVVLHVCDKAGNCVDKEVYFKFDNVKPSNVEIDDYLFENIWCNNTNGCGNGKGVSLTVSTTENLSGVDNWQYTYSSSASSVGTNENTQWVKYSNSANTDFITSEFKKEGDYSVYLRVCDKAGNCSNKISSRIKIDRTAPTLPTITNPYAGVWCTGCDTNEAEDRKYKLTLSTNEMISGVNYWQYTYNANAIETGSDHNSQWVTYSNSLNETFITSPFTAERNQNVYVRACDKAGNCSDKNNTKIMIDRHAPTLNFSMYNGNTLMSQSINGVNRYYVYNSKASSIPNTALLDFFPYLKFTVTDNLDDTIDVDSNLFGYNSPGNNSIVGTSKLSDINSSGNDYYFGYGMNTAGSRYVTFKICDKAELCTEKHVYFKVGENVNATKYNCDFYDSDNKFRLRILNVTQCGTNCTYNRLNGLGSVYSFNLDVNAPINWSIEKNKISDEIDDACSTQYYIKDNESLKCYNGVNINSGEKATITSNCKMLTVYRTTMKVDNNGNDWYYVKENDCYVEGSKLTDTEPSVCNNSGSYSATFNANGGYFSNGYTIRTYSYTNVLWLSTVEKPTKSGCTFTKWTFNGASRTNYIDYEENGGTLYAYWNCGGGGRPSGIPCYANRKVECENGVDTSIWDIGFELFPGIEQQIGGKKGKCLWRPKNQGSWSSCV